MIAAQRYAIVLLDKRWLAILSIAIIGMSLDQVTTSYAVTNSTASIESNLFLKYVFRTFPQPLHLIFYALFQTTLVTWTIMLLWSSCPKNISYNRATGISTIIAIMPMLAGINNLFVLFS
jgi:hypothetical protein